MNYTCKVCGHIIQLEDNIIPTDSSCPGCSTLLFKDTIELLTVVCPSEHCRQKSNIRMPGEPCYYCKTPLVAYTEDQKKMNESINETNRIKNKKPTNISTFLYCLAALEVIVALILGNDGGYLYLALGLFCAVATITFGSIISHLSYIAQIQTDLLIKKAVNEILDK